VGLKKKLNEKPNEKATASGQTARRFDTPNAIQKKGWFGERSESFERVPKKKGFQLRDKPQYYITNLWNI